MARSVLFLAAVVCSVYADVRPASDADISRLKRSYSSVGSDCDSTYQQQRFPPPPPPPPPPFYPPPFPPQYYPPPPPPPPWERRHWERDGEPRQQQKQQPQQIIYVQAASSATASAGTASEGQGGTGATALSHAHATNQQLQAAPEEKQPHQNLEPPAQPEQQLIAGGGTGERAPAGSRCSTCGGGSNVGNVATSNAQSNTGTALAVAHSG